MNKEKIINFIKNRKITLIIILLVFLVGFYSLYLLSNNTNFWYRFYRQVAINSCDKKQFDKAINYGERALNFAEQTEQKIQILNFITVLYANNSQYNKAEKSLNRILELLQKTGRSKDIGLTYASLAEIYIKQNKYKQAISSYEEAIKYIDDEPIKLNFQKKLTQLYIKQGEDEKALNILNNMKEYFEMKKVTENK